MDPISKEWIGMKTPVSASGLHIYMDEGTHAHIHVCRQVNKLKKIKRHLVKISTCLYNQQDLDFNSPSGLIHRTMRIISI